VQLQDTQRCTVSSALFQRTDGNAVYLGGWNRNVSVLDSEFVWLGMSAVASLGLTQQDDATGGEQPYGTLLSGLVVRELAIYEKQSSAYFLGRTPLSRVENSLFYNGPVSLIGGGGYRGQDRQARPRESTFLTTSMHPPHTHRGAQRAMININDQMGGGSNITTTLLFNTCRERCGASARGRYLLIFFAWLTLPAPSPPLAQRSGDHGNINTWDRMPFATTIASGGGAASYSPALTETTGVFAIANYGAAQGEDNDDGSSFMHIHNNFFYQADGLKM
jgi:hypothetical protein